MCWGHLQSGYQASVSRTVVCYNYSSWALKIILAQCFDSRFLVMLCGVDRVLSIDILYRNTIYTRIMCIFFSFSICMLKVLISTYS